MATLEQLTPTLAEIGAINLDRTKDANDIVQGTFNDASLHTADNVNLLATQAAEEVADRLGADNLPDELIDRARRTAALIAAVLVELGADEPRDEFIKQTMARAEARLKKLEGDITAISAGDDPGPADDVERPLYSFPCADALPPYA